MIYASWDMECDRHIFFHFGPVFALLPHYWPQKLKFEKIQKKPWRYYPFTHVYHRWRSYDAWFLRHKAQQTEFFVILGHFLPIDPPNKPKNQNLKKKWKACLEISSFYTIVPKISWDRTHDRCNCYFSFFYFLFSNSPKNQNLKKMKNTPGDIMILQKCTKNHDHKI